jgi:acetyl esterase/lipase
LVKDLEGSEICEFLNSIGVTAIILKYRCSTRIPFEKHFLLLQDAQRVISFIRFYATDLNIDSNKIGIIGFSAGAHLSVVAGNTYEKTCQYYDMAGRVSSRPISAF